MTKARQLADFISDDGQLTDMANGHIALGAIAKDISDTAVDVFVYDTIKDSDGGAWRKRTQHTSWYNEALNTATRGARKEFPAVAVIVAEVDTVTIYDADDPDMPMWMVFNASGGLTGGDMLPADDLTSTTALNAVLCYGMASSGSRNGLGRIDLIKETRIHAKGSNVYYYLGNIAERSDNKSNSQIQGGPDSIVSTDVNDIAMTVLPNAPIDADTGLPVPTIAVATDGGVSVIRDDGTIVDITNTQDSSTFNFCQDVQFRSDGGIVWSADSTGNSAAPRFVHVLHEIPTSNFVHTTVANPSNTDEFYARTTTSADAQFISAVGLQALKESTGRTNVGTTDGLSSFAYNKADAAKGLTNHINTDYNTGWMHGDIKLATLSDTDTTNAVGTELVINGTFASDTGWTKGTGWTISGGTAVASSVASGVKIEGTSFTVTAGYYTMSLDITTSASTYYWGVNGATNAGTSVESAQGTVSITRYLNAGSHYAYIGAWSSGLSGTFDNFTIRKAERDRSYNGNGLQTFGTITKTAVATGAELQGYSGWGTNNYLQHTVSTNYGSSAVVSFMGWQKTSDISNYQYMGSLIDGTSGSMFGMSINSNSTGSNAGKPYFYDSVNSSLEATRAVNDGTWHFMVGVFDGTSKKLYIDGELNASATVTALAMTNVTATNVGFYAPTISGTKQYFHLGSIALIRTSATAPSAEQIKKIYNDEKFLFQENATATLYGTSDAVTALAYDDSTELLHVGTSAGRSVFQGLRRVDNTTDAVGAAISASNGMVAGE